jgi:hypothetical protein
LEPQVVVCYELEHNTNHTDFALGLGETVSGATGGAGKDVGKGIADVGDGIEDGSGRVAKGTKDAGEWKS